MVREGGPSTTSLPRPRPVQQSPPHLNCHGPRRRTIHDFLARAPQESPQQTPPQAAEPRPTLGRAAAARISAPFLRHVLCCAAGAMNETTVAQSMARPSASWRVQANRRAGRRKLPPLRSSARAANPVRSFRRRADAPVAAASRAMPGLVAAGDTAAAPAARKRQSSRPPGRAERRADGCPAAQPRRDPANDGAAGPPCPRPSPPLRLRPPVTPPAARRPSRRGRSGDGQSVDRAAELARTDGPADAELRHRRLLGRPGRGGGSGRRPAGPPASADLRFYPVAPRPAGENAPPRRQRRHLRTLRTVKGRAGSMASEPGLYVKRPATALTSTP